MPSSEEGISLLKLVGTINNDLSFFFVFFSAYQRGYQSVCLCVIVCISTI